MMAKAGKLKFLALAAAIFLPLLSLAYASPEKPSGFVNDFAGVLSSPARTNLESNLSEHEKRTGREISVVTVSSLQGDTVENFAAELFKEWGIGKKGADNGVLLLVAPNEREVRIEVGYGLEGALPDALVGQIIRNVLVPAFQENDFDGGILEAVQNIQKALEGEALDIQSENPQNFQWSGDFVFLLLILALWLGSILGASRSWWAGGVLGGIAGVILGFIKGFIFFGIISIAILVPFGLLFDFIVSKAHAKAKASGHRPPWFFGGGFGGRGGGGFGGFGGGLSGGGGASGRW